MTDMEEQIRSIRKQLRRYMNGVTSDGMRRKGIVYKMNFGVSLDKLRVIASALEPDPLLAEMLWKEDVREFKILATMIRPLDGFTPAEAEAWASSISHQEVAEQFTANLARHLPFAPTLAYNLLSGQEEYVRVTGFLLLTRLLADGWQPDTVQADRLLQCAVEILDEGLSVVQLSAMRALKRFGVQQPENGQRILDAIAGYESGGDPVKEEFYNDLKFEFEYYP